MKPTVISLSNSKLEIAIDALLPVQLSSVKEKQVALYLSYLNEEFRTVHEILREVFGDNVMVQNITRNVITCPFNTLKKGILGSKSHSWPAFVRLAGFGNALLGLQSELTFGWGFLEKIQWCLYFPVEVSLYCWIE